jgi:hypothetical protein
LLPDWSVFVAESFWAGIKGKKQESTLLFKMPAFFSIYQIF